MSRGLFIGRFQPFHKGHAIVIRDILEKEDEIVIGIGSTQESFSVKDPLSAGERYEIIRAFLISEGLWDRAMIVTIPDIRENYVWPLRVKEYAPPFDRVYTGNILVEMLFKNVGVEVVRVKFHNREVYKGKEIRRKVLKGEPWESYIPESVLPLLKKFGFEERIKKLAKNV